MVWLHDRLQFHFGEINNNTLEAHRITLEAHFSWYVEYFFACLVYLDHLKDLQ